MHRFVADCGWAFLPLYHFKVDSGDWIHRKFMARGPPDRRWLGRISWASGEMRFPKISQQLDLHTHKNNENNNNSDEIELENYFEKCLIEAKQAYDSIVTKPPQILDQVPAPNKQIHLILSLKFT